MTKYDTLYAKDSTGNIRVWWMEQDGGKTRTCSGVLNGKLVETDWTICVGKNIGKKNETTPAEQAESEIKNRYKKQLKLSYFASIDDVDKINYIKPILAYSYKDYVDEVDFTSKEWSVQCKYNGVACLITKDGCFSRKGEKFQTLVHIETALLPFFNLYPNAVIHGELFNDDLREKLNELIKLIRKTVNITENDLKRSEEIVNYYVYDGYFPDVELDKPTEYSKRKDWIDHNITNTYDYCIHVKTTIVDSKDVVDTMFDAAIDRGDEGLMFRKMNMPYVNGRSKNLLKYKPEDSAEGIILAIKPGIGDWANTGKVITLQWEGKTFDATFKGSHEQATEFLQNADKYINKPVTFLHIGFTGLGTPASARIDINNCFRVD